MKYGYFIKKLRKSKDFTLKELSKDLMSISFLSRFERNETDITFSYLLDLLNRLNVDFDEFIAITGYKLTYKELLKEINLAYSNNNILALKYLYTKEVQLYSKHGIHTHYLNSIMIKAIIHNIDASFDPISVDEASFTSDFLMGVEYMGEYEISLFGNSLRFLEHNIIMLILNEIHKKVDSSFLLAEDLRIKLIHITLNIATITYEKNKNDDMKYALDFVSTLIGNRQLYFETNKLLFLKGLYEYSYVNEKSGKELLANSIKVMDFLGDNVSKQNHLMYIYEKINLEL